VDISVLSDIPRLLWEIFQYRRKLQVNLAQVDHIGTHGGLTLLLVHLTFANPSNRTRSVCDVRWFVPTYMQFLEIPQPHDLSNDGLLVYKLPTDADIQMSINPHELLQRPLDIPPNQSLSRLCQLLIHADFEIQYKLPFPLTVKVYDASENPRLLAKCRRNILLSNR
jgi:hypothetical protein